MANVNLRNKVVVPVVLIIGIFVGGAVVLRTKGIWAAILTEGKKVIFPIASQPDADPDNDGLKNWEEDTYRTDPRNPDTDGDGYLDGEETASGYDPTIPAPNDALAGTDTSSPRPLPKNLTTQLAQLLAEKIAKGEVEPSTADKISLDDSSIPYNQEIIDEVFYEVGQRAKQYFAMPEMRDEDIKISTQPTDYEEIGRYITAMSQAVATGNETGQSTKTEPEIIKEAVETKNMRKIEILLESYQQGVEKTKQVTTPKDFADIHKKQLAIFMQLEKIMTAIKNLEEDPAMASAAIESYPPTIDALIEMGKELVARIEQYQD